MSEQKSPGFRTPLLLSLLLIAVMMGLSIYGWAELPPDIRLPIHWNAAGQVDGYGSKYEALLFAPGSALVVTILLAVIPFIEPRRGNLLRSSKAYGAVWVAIIFMLFLTHLGMLAAAFGYGLGRMRLFPAGFGVFCMVAGNFMGKVRSNFFFGIRTPWTLSSDRVWDKTHRLGGPLFFLYGLALTVAAVLARPALIQGVFLGGLVVVSITVIAYSYLLWRAEQKPEANS